MTLVAAGSTASDRRTLLVAAALRATGTSMVGVLLAIYLAEAGLGPSAIGAISTAGLSGAAVAALLITVGGDRWGRRRSLVLLAVLGAVAFCALLFLRATWGIAVLAFVGMVNAMGRDRGGASVLEQATLPATVPPEGRTLAFAWYAALQDAGHALGSLLAALPTTVVALAGLSQLPALRTTLALYPALLLVSVPLYLRLSAAVENPDLPETSARHRLSGESRAILFRISALFALDGLGGGLLVTTLLSYYFFHRFGVSGATVAALFFAARLANLGSNFGAAWLARRIGLVNTMVFTHIPSSLLLMAVAFVPSFRIAAALFLLRESLVEMDVPTRQSYVMAMVAPEERTAAAGVTHLVRLGAWAVGPVVAGWAMERFALGTPLILGAAIKVLYDLLLWWSFRHRRPPEELEG
jgi:MFS family permease